MATVNVVFQDDLLVDVDAAEWFDGATEDDIKEMFNLCKGYFQDMTAPSPTTLPEAEFQSKLRNLQDRYLSLSPEQIQLILSI